jgi:DNA polymerase I
MQNLLFSDVRTDDKWFHTEKCNYHIIDTDKKLVGLSNYLEQFKILSFDIETTGLEVGRSKIVGFSICPKIGEAYYIPTNAYTGDSRDEKRNVSNDLVVKYFKDLLETKLILGHNLKFDYMFFLFVYGIRINVTYDTFVMARLIDEFEFSALKYLGEVLLDFEVLELDPILKEFTIKHKNLDLLKVEEIYEYGCQDVDLARRLFYYFVNDYKWRPSKIYDTEIELISGMADMELKGISLESNRLRQTKIELEEDVNILESKIYSILGGEFNISSNEQFQARFVSTFPDLLTMIKLTENKVMKLDKETVDIYIENFDACVAIKTPEGEQNIFELFKERKHIFSILTKYVYPWLNRIEKEKSNIIRTNFTSLRTATGRMTSSKPNLQQVPKSMKDVFVPRKDHYFIEFDFDQMEYRIFAAMAELDHLLEEMNTGDCDIHTLAASLLYDIPIEEVTKEIRRSAKTLNFGIIYGMGLKSLSQSLNISMEDAEELRFKYNNRFLKNTVWFERVLEFARTRGYVLTSFGRKRRIENLNLNLNYNDAEYKENKRLVSAGERIAINTPIQGTSADITKKALVNARKILNENIIDGTLLVVVHDSFLFEINNKHDIKDIAPMLKEALEFNFKDKVTLTVDCNTSKTSWGEMVPYEITN